VKRAIPDEILTQHTAVLGKTGSGKTSTAKLAIEQVVADGARVCVLDPIKSDWWGLTSSANGKHAGLPFHILGGPHGHVPLHSAAGKAIADVVASSALPLSIIDMADFEPGGQAKFFVDFAPTLLRKMRGVVYLVIEEAHLFAPKERSGIGAENLSIHWAKTLATAGRSKGVRLMLVTQRTQALHNALLGSCDTLIAHRLTAPADQEPVVKWLKANTSREVLEEVSGSLASLKTGEGWICSGEAKLFERVHFPRIATYDNTATPTGDGETREIKTAAVDADKLRTLIGQAVDQAKADDPRELKKRIAHLERQLRTPNAQPAPSKVETKTVEKFVLKDGQIDRFERATKAFAAVVDRLTEHESAARSKAIEAMTEVHRAIASTRAPQRDTPTTKGNGHRVAPSAQQPRLPVSVPAVSGNGHVPLKGMHRAMLTALAQHPDGLSKKKILIHTGYASSGPVSTAFAELAREGYVATTPIGGLAITDAGIAALGSYDPLPTGAALREWLLTGDKLSTMEKALLRAICDRYPEPVKKGDVLQDTKYASSGPVSSAFAKLVGLGYVNQSGPSLLTAADELF
jgi:hypothetical protein